MLSWAHHISHLSEECEMPIMCRSSKTASLLDVKLPTHCCIMRLTAQHRDVFECCLHLKCVLLFIFCLFILWTEHKLLLGPTEPWSVREKLCLASSVMKSGDQNWWFFIFIHVYHCFNLLVLNLFDSKVPIVSYNIQRPHYFSSCLWFLLFSYLFIYFFELGITRKM